MVNYMTKDEAYIAMQDGKKVSREYFSFNEYIWMDDKGVIRSEEGYNFTEWWNKTEPLLDNGNKNPWTIFK